MRVISGSAKGIQLASVPGDSTRPITDKVKEALFNILGPEVIGMTILDLFAGTGAVGIEALSRGAAHVRFLDINYRAYKIIRKNLKTTKLEPYADVLKKDAFDLIHSEPDQSFDIIYIAPPQYKGIWVEAMRELDQNINWLNENGMVIVQIHPKELDDSLGYANLREFDKREYGDTILLFFERILHKSDL